MPSFGKSSGWRTERSRSTPQGVRIFDGRSTAVHRIFRLYQEQKIRSYASKILRALQMIRKIVSVPTFPILPDKIFRSSLLIPEEWGIERDVKIASGHGSRQTPLKESILTIYRAYPAPVWRESERFFRVHFSTPGKSARSREIPHPSGDDRLM